MGLADQTLIIFDPSEHTAGWVFYLLNWDWCITHCLPPNTGMEPRNHGSWEPFCVAKLAKYISLDMNCDGLAPLDPLVTLQ